MELEFSATGGVQAVQVGSGPENVPAAESAAHVRVVELP